MQKYLLANAKKVDVSDDEQAVAVDAYDDEQAVAVDASDDEQPDTDDSPLTTQLTTALPEQVGEQHIEIFRNAALSISTIKSLGASTGFMDQQEAEVAIVTRGNAELEFENGLIVTLSAGQHCYIPPHTKHRVSQTSPDCEWVCVYMTL